MVAAVADGGRLILIDVGSGRRITLDMFGARVWTLLTPHPTLGGLLTEIRRDDERAELIAEDTTHLLASWRRRGLITWR